MSANALEEVRAVVTGGADSTGLAVATQLSLRGARVHIADVREDAIRRACETNQRLTGTVADIGRSAESPEARGYLCAGEGPEGDG